MLVAITCANNTNIDIGIIAAIVFKIYSDGITCINAIDAALIYADGSLSSFTHNDTGGLIRPALWVNIESDIF